MFELKGVSSHSHAINQSFRLHEWHTQNAKLTPTLAKKNKNQTYIWKGVDGGYCAELIFS